jgi:hypothetical protein
MNVPVPLDVVSGSLFAGAVLMRGTNVMVAQFTANGEPIPSPDPVCNASGTSVDIKRRAGLICTGNQGRPAKRSPLRLCVIVQRESVLLPIELCQECLHNGAICGYKIHEIHAYYPALAATVNRLHGFCYRRYK